MKFTLKPQTIEAITFDELVEHGRQVAPEDAAMHGGMAWSFKWNGHAITHHNDNAYLIQTRNDQGHVETGVFERGSDYLVDGGVAGLFILTADDIEHGYEPEEPDTSPMGLAGTRNPNGTTNVAAGFLVYGAVRDTAAFPKAARKALGEYLNYGRKADGFESSNGLHVSLALFGQEA